MSARNGLMAKAEASRSGVPVELYENPATLAYGIEAAGVLIAVMENRDEAIGAYYLLSALPAAAMTALIDSVRASGVIRP